MNISEILLLIVLLITGLLLAIFLFPYLMDLLAEKSKGRGVSNGPWKTHLGVGRKETPAIERSAIARIGLGANSSDETIYWNAFTDSDGDQLNSAYNYDIILTDDIKVDYENFGFWSITVYGKDKYLVNNPFNKYMFRSCNSLVIDSKRKLCINLRADYTKNEKFMIPLPREEENFSLALRCYRPLDSMKVKRGAEMMKLPVIIKIR
ncbi:MAG: DUF1214 domain-containing protein [Marinilabiliaceae bacterium]|jgi:hypothetical protein|nr:DUF1214 domain-containing protein [Marinilabiliaceae bacterium]